MILPPPPPHTHSHTCTGKHHEYELLKSSKLCVACVIITVALTKGQEADIEVAELKIFVRSENNGPGAKTIKKNTNSTQNKYQTHRAKQYEVTSFLSTDCELSTETCSKNVYSLGPRSGMSISEGQRRWDGLARKYGREAIRRWFGYVRMKHAGNIRRYMLNMELPGRRTWAMHKMRYIDAVRKDMAVAEVTQKIGPNGDGDPVWRVATLHLLTCLVCLRRRTRSITNE